MRHSRGCRHPLEEVLNVVRSDRIVGQIHRERIHAEALRSKIDEGCHDACCQTPVCAGYGCCLAWIPQAIPSRLPEQPAPPSPPVAAGSAGPGAGASGFSCCSMGCDPGRGVWASWVLLERRPSRLGDRPRHHCSVERNLSARRVQRWPTTHSQNNARAGRASKAELQPLPLLCLERESLHHPPRGSPWTPNLPSCAQTLLVTTSVTHGGNGFVNGHQLV